MAKSILKHLVVAGAIFSTVAVAAEHKARPHALYLLWAKITQPRLGPAEALGGYSAGCLVGAKKLPLTGEGYQVMRPQRLRYFGHPALLNFIRTHAKENKQAGGGDLLIGDMSRPRGGPTISGHVSHQTGLDVDIWYWQASKQLSLKRRSMLSSPVYVKGERVRHWQKNYTRLLQKIAEDPHVDRIFVNPSIKAELCRETKGEELWLAKLRPWWGHADHFHVRLHCPAGNSNCRAQEPVDPGHAGCGKDLAWWFSQEAKDELAKQQKVLQSKDRPFPELPKDCEKLTFRTARAE